MRLRPRLCRYHCYGASFFYASRHTRHLKYRSPRILHHSRTLPPLGSHLHQRSLDWSLHCLETRRLGQALHHRRPTGGVQRTGLRCGHPSSRRGSSHNRSSLNQLRHALLCHHLAEFPNRPQSILHSQESALHSRLSALCRPLSLLRYPIQLPWVARSSCSGLQRPRFFAL